MSGGDGTNPSTQVHVVRCVWVPVTMSYRAKHLMLLPPEASAPTALPSTERPSCVTAGDPGTYRAESHRGSTIDRQMVKSCLLLAILTEGRTSADHSWV
jgi:hypothetical protein